LVARQLYQGLVDWSETKSAVVPGVAKSWSSSNHERNWTFHLRSSRFTDGNPVTANDFIFAFDRIAQKRSGSDLAFLLDEVKGFAKVNSGRASGLRPTTTPCGSN
jgi:ABC-type oligopeptide transport system substrate-binding subunit